CCSARNVRTTIHRHVISWIEAMTKVEAGADWIRWCLDGSPIVGWGCTIRGYTWQSANAYLFFAGLVRMKKLVLATVCLVALTVGAQAKPVHLGLIDNKWVIE